MGLVHHPTTYNDPLWGQDADVRDETERQILGFQGPGRVVAGQSVGRLPPTRCQRWARGKPFQTISMIGAQTRKWIRLSVVGKAHVPHLRVQEAVEHASMHNSSTPDTSAYGDVEKGVEPLGGSPALLGERCGVHISVEGHW